MNNEKLQESKPIQIIMNKGAHAQLKRRAKQLDNKIGDFVENLLSSLEFRINNLYKETGIETKSEIADIEFMRMIFNHDRFGLMNLTKQEYYDELDATRKRIIDESPYEEWQPEYKLY